MANVQLKDISKAYGETVVMENMNFSIHDQERLVLLGPSGCGKSTILRMIAGFVPITSGDMLIDGKRVNDLPPDKRDVSMVFQNYALYPHMTVDKNIRYALEVHKVAKDEIQRRVDSVVGFLKLAEYMARKPAQLSGGQRQRVALARAIVKNAPLFLLDEPLSNLDAQLRVQARESLMDIHHEYAQTMVYVTHDQVEAMAFGTRVALLNFGELQQIDTPENVYHMPANVFTARFIGSPPANIVPGVEIHDGNLVWEGSGFRLRDNWLQHLASTSHTGLTLGVRPEHIKFDIEPIDGSMECQIQRVENMGGNYVTWVRAGSETFCGLSPYRVGDVGDRVWMKFTNDQLHFFDSETTKNLGYPPNVKRKKDALSSRSAEVINLLAQERAAQAQEEAARAAAAPQQSRP